ncbi:MAG: peptide chain release factor 1 [Endomicrobium sp.]|jgi:peptide chain release factor 1|nr:peptide chain release factor 1 [Endomicrobium sp.]
MYFKKLRFLNAKFQEVESKLSDLSVVLNQEEYKKFSKQYSYLRPIAEKYMQYLRLLNSIKDIEELKNSKDFQIKELAFAEYDDLVEVKNKIESEIKILLIPPDPNDDKNIIVEIRAGTGGDESALFVGDLYRMYARFAEKKGWECEILNSSSTGLGGYKEIIFEINGSGVWCYFKFEKGTHRVQRVPETEISGRVHTSAVTVAIFPEAEEVDVEIKMEDLRIDTYRSSGAGGQHVNKTNSAIRITHLPTGLVVACQDERSQMKNRAKAFKVLRAKLYNKKILENANQISNERKLQIGTGDRSEKIRTYNYPQNRITDHRIGYSMYNIKEVMDGDLSGLVNKLIEAEMEFKLNENNI